MTYFANLPFPIVHISSYLSSRTLRNRYTALSEIALNYFLNSGVACVPVSENYEGRLELPLLLGLLLLYTNPPPR